MLELIYHKPDSLITTVVYDSIFLKTFKFITGD